MRLVLRFLERVEQEREMLEDYMDDVLEGKKVPTLGIVLTAWLFIVSAITALFMVFS